MTSKTFIPCPPFKHCSIQQIPETRFWHSTNGVARCVANAMLRHLSVRGGKHCATTASCAQQFTRKGCANPYKSYIATYDRLGQKEDWSGLSPEEHKRRWSEFLRHDRAQPLMLTEAPVMRFALIRLDDHTWKFLWTVPALLLDGWSWPVVFRDASRLYQSFSQNVSVEMGKCAPIPRLSRLAGPTTSRRSARPAARISRDSKSRRRFPGALRKWTPTASATRNPP